MGCRVEDVAHLPEDYREDSQVCGSSVSALIFSRKSHWPNIQHLFVLTHLSHGVDNLLHADHDLA